MADEQGGPSRSWLVISVAAIGGALLAAALTVGFSSSGLVGMDGMDDAVPESAGDATPTSTTPSASESAPDPRLLPNMRSLQPRNISIKPSASGLSLRFDGTLANVGVGPLEVVPDKERPCPPGQRHASQRIYQDTNANGSFDAGVDRPRTRRPAGCLLFHPTHTHWHLDASARYALTAADGDAVVAEEDKVSFCLRDNERVPGVQAPARDGDGYGKCARDRIQGISVGWADVYDASLPGQELELPRGMPDGVYCLRIDADPLDLLLESVEGDNGVVRAITITGRRVGPATPESCSR